MLRDFPDIKTAHKWCEAENTCLPEWALDTYSDAPDCLTTPASTQTLLMDGHKTEYIHVPSASAKGYRQPGMTTTTKTAQALSRKIKRVWNGKSKEGDLVRCRSPRKDFEDAFKGSYKFLREQVTGHQWNIGVTKTFTFQLINAWTHIERNTMMRIETFPERTREVRMRQITERRNSAIYTQILQKKQDSDAMIRQRLDTLQIKDAPRIKSELPAPPADVRRTATLSIPNDPWGVDSGEQVPMNPQQPTPQKPMVTTTTIKLEVKDGKDPWYNGMDEDAKRRKTQEIKPDVAMQATTSSTVALKLIKQEEIDAAHKELEKWDTQDDHLWNQMQNEHEATDPVAAMRDDRPRSRYTKAPVNTPAPDGGTWSTWSYNNRPGSRGKTSWENRSAGTSSSSTTRATATSWTSSTSPPWREAPWKEAPWKR
jgi:hypothetical protein